jgi:CDGSH-type Zn-finger protein
VPARDTVVITPYRDGPWLVRGPVRLVDCEGREIPCRRNPIALCRCGKSRLRPFCDGTHRLVGFRAPGAPDSDGRELEQVELEVTKQGPAILRPARKDV